MRAIIRSGLYEWLARAALRRLVGTRPPRPTNFDAAYETSSTRQVAALFSDALRRTPRERLDSLVVNLRATLDADNAGLTEEVTVRAPVLRIIAERDVVWGRDLPQQGRRRLPHLTERVVAGARRHKAVFFRARPFYDALTCALRDTGRPVGPHHPWDLGALTDAPPSSRPAGRSAGDNSVPGLDLADVTSFRR